MAQTLLDNFVYINERVCVKRNYVREVNCAIAMSLWRVCIYCSNYLQPETREIRQNETDAFKFKWL